MHNLKKKIINTIRKNSGNISIEKFIEICLFDKNGYYKKKQPIGKAGDFITAPEISQLFGEILGLYIVNIWQQYFNCKFNLIELGPGKGTLLDDILRVGKKFNFFLDNANINLIEINKDFIKYQKKVLLKNNISTNQYQWKTSFKLIKSKPSIIYANEFFDCFAIKQFININKKWHEKRIDFNNKEQKFSIFNKPINNKILSKELDFLNSQNNKNQILEISKNRSKYFNNLCNFIKNNLGIIIIIDYGYFNPPNYSSLQSVKYHRKTSILENPGNQDITSLVDFKNLKEIAEKNNLHTYGPYTQEQFLKYNGILERKNKILSSATKNQKKIIENGFNRLVAKDQMGKIFKCLIVSTYKMKK